jgi:hypothetical protein
MSTLSSETLSVAKVSFEPVELSKVIPARVERVRFRWVNAEFSVMGPRWRAVRAKMKDRADSCRWCRHRFEDGETMALAAPEKGANWLLCQKCLTEMQHVK